MAATLPLRPDSETLWEAAVRELSEENRKNINFNNQHKREALTELHKLIEQQQEKCKNKRWKFKGLKGNDIIMRDILAKWVRWLDHYKTIGDVGIQVNPGAAALPWAGFRFILQIAVNETDTFEFFAEKFTSISEIICRSSIHEELCSKAQTSSTPELKRSLTLLYKNILLFLGNVRKYYTDNTLKRIFKAGTLEYTSAMKHFDDIIAAEQKNYALSLQVMSEDNTDRLMDIKRQLDDINVPMARWDNTLEKINDNLDNQTRNKILDWVSTELYMRHHTHTKKGVIKNTGRWLLDHPTYRAWRNESTSSLFWLHGIPGSGKSKLVSIVVDSFLREFQDKHCPQPVYFYCTRNQQEPARSDPTSILACLAGQLCCIQPGEPLLDPIITEYKKHPRSKSLTDVLQPDDIRDLILDLINKFPTVTIIIDALDEVNSATRSELLQNLETILEESASLVKIFVSSRDDQDIVHQLQDYSELEIKNGNSGDIKEFARLGVGQLVKKRSWQFKDLDPDWMIEKLIEKANGMFLWVDLQLRSLSKLKTSKAVEQRLGEMSPELEDIYEETLNQIEASPSSIDHEYAQITFGLLLCARRELSMSEFLGLVAWYLPLHNGEAIRSVSKDQILDICCNLVTFDSDTDSFRFAHLSVREFLESKSSYTAERSNSMVAQSCLRRLSRIPYSLPRHEIAWEKSGYHNFWAIHCRAAGVRQRSQGHLKTLVANFFTKEASHGLSPYFYFCEAWRARDISHTYMLVSGGKRSIGGATLQWAYLDACAFDPSEASSILFTACAFDLCEIVEEHIEKDRVDPNVKNSKAKSLLEVALSLECKETVKLLVHNACVKVTEAEVEAAICRDWGRELIATLLKKAEIKCGVVARRVAKNGTADVMEMLLENEKEDIKITEDVMISAVQNRRDGQAMVKLLVANGVREVKLTEALIRGLSWNYHHQTEIMTFLLTCQHVDVKVTEEAIHLGVRYLTAGSVSLLLARVGDGFEITEELMRSAAGNHRGKEVLQLLFGKKTDIPLTSEVFAEAISEGGLDNLKWLLDSVGNISVSEDMLVKAAGTVADGIDKLKLLLERDEKASITEEVMIELVREQYPYELSKFWARRDDIPVTEKILVEAAGRHFWAVELLKLLLEKDEKASITEKVMLELVKSQFPGELQKVYKMRDNIPMTEGILRIAAESINNETKNIEWSLDKLDDDTCITGRVLLQILRSGYCQVLDKVIARWGSPVARRLVTEMMAHTDRAEWDEMEKYFQWKEGLRIRWEKRRKESEREHKTPSF